MGRLNWRHGQAQELEVWWPDGVCGIKAEITYDRSEGRCQAEVGGCWRQRYSTLGGAKAGVRKQLIRARACLNKMELGG